MRTGELKSLLAVLRAQGVSEFTDSKRGVSVKFGAPVAAPVSVGRGKKAVQVEESAQAELESALLADKNAQRELQRLGVDVQTAARELLDVA